MKYDWLLFDADHTLFDFDRSAEESLYLTMEEAGLNPNGNAFEIYREINVQCWREFEHGLITREELTTKRFTLFFENQGIVLDPLQFHHDYLAKLPMRPYLLPGALELLEEVSKHHTLGLITNGLKEVQRPRLINADMEKYFSVIVISGEIGFQKPDHAYFNHAYTKMGEPDKSRVLVIGDNLHADIGGGLGFGFHTCWYNPAGSPGDPAIEPHFEIRALEHLQHHIRMA